MTQPNEELKPCPLKPCERHGTQPTQFGVLDAYRCEECYKNQGWMSAKDWNRRAQSPPVAQVEVYRMALEMISQHEDCLCKPGMEVVKEALLTSKPEQWGTK